MGGIEKLCRILSKALYDISLISGASMVVHSLHDQKTASKGNRYLPSEYFRGFGGSRISFIINSIRKAIRADIVLLSHINLLPVGWMIKKLSPNTQIILFAHGIEIWEIPLGFRKYMLGACDRFLCVSRYTKERLTSMHGVPDSKCEVLNNCLDPFLPQGRCLEHYPDIKSNLGIASHSPIVFTLARMQAGERYKGYDKILRIIPSLKQQFPGLKYVMGGKSDSEELAYLTSMIAEMGLSEDVKIVGFISDEQLPSYFQMADVFVMPSYNEGFGITFIESLYYGLPVLTGNIDGSRDVMISSSFGMMADPFDKQEISNVLQSLLGKLSSFRPDKNALMNHFGYDHYLIRLMASLAA
jgi:glycosyltransferase involved in cell wall biosynthesis